MAGSKGNVPAHMVADMLLDALEGNERVLKVKVDGMHVSGNGFLFKREGSIDVLVQNKDRSFSFHDGQSLKGGMRNAGILSLEDVQKIASAYPSSPQTPSREGAVEEAVFSRASQRIKQHLSELSELIGLPVVNDEARPIDTNPLYHNSFHRTNTHWYQGLADKLEVVSRQLHKQSDHLPYLRESVAPIVAGFKQFDVGHEAESQYHKREQGLLGQLEKAIERNAVLIDSGMIVSASFDDARKTLSVDVYNQSMRKVASAESHPLVVSEHEAQAPESITFSCGEGSRLVSQHVSFHEATWQIEGNCLIAEYLTDALSTISADDLSMIIHTDVYDADNEKVTDFERIDFYEDPSAHAQADLTAKGMNVMAVSQLDKEDSSLMLTRICKKHIGNEMEALRVIIPQSPDLPGVGCSDDYNGLSDGP